MHIGATLYEKLGLMPVINACGTMTYLGGSRLDPRVVDAMREASDVFVDMAQLHDRAGEYIASLLHAEACCITSGAAAGLAIAGAAAMAGVDPAYVLQLPDTEGMRSEALMLKCHRTMFDQALRLAGMTIREIGNVTFACMEQALHAITPNTAMLLYTAEAAKMSGSIPLEDIVPALHARGVPVMVDAAAEIPPASYIDELLALDVDAVILSGGKELRGPQASGLILGKKEFIAACNANCCPHYSVGRCMKVDKESIAGIVRAVELFVWKDYDAEMRRWDGMVRRMMDELRDVASAEFLRGFPTPPGIQPVCIPRMYVRPLRISAQQLHDRLCAGKPGIDAHIEGDAVAINPQCLLDEEIPKVISGIRAALAGDGGEA